VLEKEGYWGGLDESEGCLDRWFVGRGLEGIGLLGLRLDWLVGGEMRSGCGGSLNDAEDCAESVGNRVGLCASCGLLEKHS
jgi:hypothetical protein